LGEESTLATLSENCLKQQVKTELKTFLDFGGKAWENANSAALITLLSLTN